ncbi:EmrB/QacA family drug resistance transporter [Hypericibacter adhaerens]|uniref:EmrB/QacA family drug resistance transporter n=1 Tax=Hypericibacter adhaerens TaxID=2602016 RepID=A0A5J6N301_9PROT|nr:MDR family MFS transporter [Hypericibacter adhaerens]QEX24109.1 EmrB/QacA family drug resistance transporter [Hypericibacter adhaerens]
MSAVETFESSPRLVLPAPAAKPASNENDGASVSAKTWLAVVGSALGAFLAVLNIQVVNSALADIQGAIGAGIDDGGWISTAYLISEIIVIPLSGWLSKVFSTRRYLLVNTLLFLLFSAACAHAENLGQMIVLRALQGFAGGVLIPMAFTIIITMLPRAKQPIGMALFAVSAVFAPAIGPTIGGYLNENFGWQYIFYVNLAPGIVMLVMLWFSLEREPMQLSLLKGGDWLGVITMAIGLGSLQTVLEEGNKDDWFGSTFITRLSVIAAISLTAFIAIELTVKKPLLHLRLLLRRNFGFATLATMLLGMVLYGSVFVLSLYLSQMQGYNAEQIGEVLAWVGLPQLLLIPLVPKLTKWIDTRLLIAGGLALFAASNFMNIHLTDDVAGPELFLPNIVRAIGQAVTLAPLSAIAVAGIERQFAGSASAIFNMTRNLGGAIGIALLQTVLTNREKFHSEIITSDVTLFDEATRQRLHDLTQYFLAHGVSDPATAWREAVVAIGRSVHQQASIMGYGDAFYLQGVILVLALVCTFFMKKVLVEGGGGGH